MKHTNVRLDKYWNTSHISAVYVLCDRKRTKTSLLTGPNFVKQKLGFTTYCKFTRVNK